MPAAIIRCEGLVREVIAILATVIVFDGLATKIP
jgi:hypothetical protein